MSSKEDTYNGYLKNAMFAYYDQDVFRKHYGRVPLQRDQTFKHCIEHFKDYDYVNIVELGTTRSFVDGKYPGVCKNDLQYWEPDALDKWDWSAGVFTKYFSDILRERGQKFRITTVDISQAALDICKTITSDVKEYISYINCSSEEFIRDSFEKSIDLLYLDTGNMDEGTAQLHLREAKLLLRRQIVKDEGLILIDDVRNPGMLIRNRETNKLGKSKYSIPCLLDKYEVIMDEYQVILKKKPSIYIIDGNNDLLGSFTQHALFARFLADYTCSKLTFSKNTNLEDRCGVLRSNSSNMERKRIWAYIPRSLTTNQPII